MDEADPHATKANEAMFDALMAQVRATELLDESSVDNITDTLASADPNERENQIRMLLAEWQPRVLQALLRERDVTLAALIKNIKVPNCGGDVATLASALCGGVDESALATNSVATLKSLIIGAGLTHADCSEKSELVSRAAEAVRKGAIATIDAPLIAVAESVKPLRDSVSSPTPWLHADDATALNCAARRDAKYGYILRAGSATSWDALRTLDQYEPVLLLLLSPDGAQMGVAGPLAPAALLGHQMDGSATSSTALRVEGRSKRALSKLSRIAPDVAIAAPTLLHIACEYDNGAAVKALAAAGCDVEKREVTSESDKRSPMHIAATCGGLDALRALHEAGAALTSTHPFSGAMPLHIATQNNHAAAVELVSARERAKSRAPHRHECLRYVVARSPHAVCAWRAAAPDACSC